MYVVASDHGGFELKEAIVALLKERGLEHLDMGPINLDSVDYPDFGAKVAGAVSSGEADAGILICGTGIGMSIVANKFQQVRAALVHDSFTAQMAKEHNNANVLVLGGRILSVEQGVELVKIWLDTEYAGGRHQKRLDKIHQYEQEQIS
ncbi:MAG: ribose 5-phosphate isomerase B [Desulfuromonas sp.]|jgi:ribose 5-phosphate isomerase B|nr:MAG: ribose 5-phosphate isomerase B [Desulfuromonas sp.]